MHLLPELASHHAVSIPELLVSRDERQARQHAWLKRHPVPLVSFTVVAPVWGCQKKSLPARSKSIFRFALFFPFLLNGEIILPDNPRPLWTLFLNKGEKNGTFWPRSVF